VARPLTGGRNCCWLARQVAPARATRSPSKIVPRSYPEQQMRSDTPPQRLERHLSADSRRQRRRAASSSRPASADCVLLWELRTTISRSCWSYPAAR